MSYATYAGDSRSSWERLDWVKPHAEASNAALRPLSEADASRRAMPFKMDDEIIFEDETPEGEIYTIVVEVSEAAARPIVEEDKTNAWARVGYVILAGLLIAVFGFLCRFVIASPVPLAIAGIGMAAVSIALWYGGRLEQPT